MTATDVQYAGAEHEADLRAAFARAYPKAAPPTFDFFAGRYLLARAKDDALGYLSIEPSRRDGDPPGKFWAHLTLERGPDDLRVMWALYQALSAHPGARLLYTMTPETQRACGC